MTIVIKIGGSLLFSPHLEKVCNTINNLAKKQNLVVVPGGGRFSDLVRDLQKEQNFSDETAHLMALKSMELYGILLHDLMPKLHQARSLKVGKNRSVVFSPFQEVRDCELESSWEVTSDSIAAWICGEMECEKLVLIKRVDGIRKAGRLQTSVNVGELEDMKQSIVDPRLSGILKKYGILCWILNGEYPKRIEELLESGATKGTKIVPVER